MNIDDPRWESYETKFRALAERISIEKGPQAALASAELILCLYGDNAMSPDQEFETLEQLEKHPNHLKGAIILTAYWEDIVLYLPYGKDYQ